MALRELRNQQRPGRPPDRTYGKKKGLPATARAIRFDLFGGDENEVSQKLSQLTMDEKDLSPVRPPKVRARVKQKLSKKMVVWQGEPPLEPNADIIITILQTLSEEDTAKIVPLLAVATSQVDLTDAGSERDCSASATAEPRVAGDARKQDFDSPLLSKKLQVEDFRSWGIRAQETYSFTLLGDGSYGSAFRLDSHHAKTAAKISRTGGLVVKIVPLDIGQVGAISNSMKTTEVVREIEVMKLLAVLHGFPQYRGCSVVFGKWPKVLVDAFREYSERHPEEMGPSGEFDEHERIPDDAENESQPIPYRDHPSNPNVRFRLPRAYAMIEMTDAGSAIADIKHPSVYQVYDIFWMTVIYLKNAEQKRKFEHRDLHNSNICYTAWNKDQESDIDQEILDDENVPPQVLGLSNMRITIIDFTLSRAKREDGVILFDPIYDFNNSHDVHRPDDKETHIQVETYFKVRNLARKNAQAAAATDRIPYDENLKYRPFMPQSNVIWLASLLRGLIMRAGDGRARLRPSSRRMRSMQLELWDQLETVATVINGESADVLPDSAAGLLDLALGMRWVKEEDIKEFERRVE